MIAIVIMVTCDLLLGLSTPKLEVPEKFEPTNKEHRGWVVVPFNEKNPWWICIAAVVPALLGTILIFMDQQITAVIVNRKENKLTVRIGSDKGEYHIYPIGTPKLLTILVLKLEQAYFTTWSGVKKLMAEGQAEYTD